jgi:hypothetical protein
MHQKKTSFSDSANQSEFIPIGNWLAILWRDRLLVIVITLLIMTLSFSWAKLHATYKSEGFFLFGGPIPIVKEKPRDKSREKEQDKEPSLGISLPDFKRYSASFTTSERFGDYIGGTKIVAAPIVDELTQVFASRAGIRPMIEPIYPFTKLDSKDLVEQPKGNNNVIGLRISYESSSPYLAQKTVALLGRYAIDSIVYFIYADAIRSKQDNIKTEATKLDNIIINNKIQLEQFQRRVADLKKVIADNPVAANNSARQVVEVSEDTARYLPPTTLLTTAQIQISETNEAILRARQDQRRNTLLLEYYDRARKILDTTKSGENLLHNLDEAKQATFKGKDMQDDVVKEIYNNISVDNQIAISLYFDRSRFIAGPTLPRYSTSRPILALAVGLLFGFFLSVLFLFVRHWWRQVRPALEVSPQK